MYNTLTCILVLISLPKIFKRGIGQEHHSSISLGVLIYRLRTMHPVLHPSHLDWEYRQVLAIAGQSQVQSPQCRCREVVVLDTVQRMLKDVDLFQ